MYSARIVCQLFLVAVTVTGVIRSASVRVLPDLGAPDYSCPADVMAPSGTVPTSAHRVRPADIKIIAALGDSLTAGNGAGATNAVELLLQYRGLTFAMGGDRDLNTHVSVANILKRYNSQLFGYSNGIGTVNVWEAARLNSAVPGAESGDLPGQARDLVHKMQIHPEVNIQQDWKLINIFIGGNDICAYCHDNGNGMHSPQHFSDNIRMAIQILYDNLPRTIVSLTQMFHMEMLRTVDGGHLFCQGLHVFECDCEQNQQFTNEEIATICRGYQEAQQALLDSAVFDQRDDFTLVMQPFFRDVTTPPLLANGHVDESFFAPDCFHFSQFGHAVVAKALWNNLLEPVGAKTTAYNLTNFAVPLACPQSNCPYIRTSKNSVDCGARI